MTTSGTLYLVGTPIGNLDDMTFRAIATLKNVDLIAAEDTRHTGKLLKHFQITTPQISYHDHNRHQRQTQLLEKLRSGLNIALVSDAGLPGISDPGFELVTSAIDAEITVVPIPGVSAGLTGLIASGLSPEKFVFEGFLPPKKKDRHQLLTELSQEPRTLIFYEAPHRLVKTLTDLLEHFEGDRPLVCARELTKLHEEFWRGPLETALTHYQQHNPKGEFTLILAGASPQTDHEALTDAEILAQLQALMQQGMSRSGASRTLAQQLNLSRRHIYQLSTELEG
ncbi:16S rRNA (cytidine(1402)-2'-O)-methyltransferase [Picosynechococcus sp. PCC 7117]|uniref:16S rRNA (cytidine(1402)-2'-O)-methyltransferase n=1 Tax=Picosynechococcus sp. PCC 7117 TaxID=195498 RepID=UPI000810467A|nr:16S rRNA (cytidine(1402)-2'-O)-methyltransferase [Picosynechococcus sp. PCC 7117]ANV88097.1 16S rRNA (cytidine(1402)-2'-O)-methyltransferase [Picosynechococcus sp. PCC 7117]